MLKERERRRSHSRRSRSREPVPETSRKRHKKKDKDKKDKDDRYRRSRARSRQRSERTRERSRPRSRAKTLTPDVQVVEPVVTGKKAREAGESTAASSSARPVASCAVAAKAHPVPVAAGKMKEPPTATASRPPGMPPMMPQQKADEHVSQLLRRFPNCKVEKQSDTQAESHLPPMLYVGQSLSLEVDEGRWDLRRHCILCVVGNTFDTDSERPIADSWIRNNRGNMLLSVAKVIATRTGHMLSMWLRACKSMMAQWNPG